MSIFTIIVKTKYGSSIINVEAENSNDAISHVRSIVFHPLEEKDIFWSPTKSPAPNN